LIWTTARSRSSSWRRLGMAASLTVMGGRPFPVVSTMVRPVDRVDEIDEVMNVMLRWRGLIVVFRGAKDDNP
jgi:hypothetical protein